MRYKKEKNSVDNAEYLSGVVDALSSQKQEFREPVKEHTPKKESRRERRKRKKSEKALRRKARKLVIPKTVQETIPYLRVYPESGIIETENGFFTKTYLLGDVNYYVARLEEQTNMFLKFGDLLNSFVSYYTIQLTDHKFQRNLAEFEAETRIAPKNNFLDPIIESQNAFLREKVKESNSNLDTGKYLTVRIPAPNYETALTAFSRLDTEISNNVKQIGGASATSLSTAQRLEILHNIYNPNQVGLFGNLVEVDSQSKKLTFAKERFSFDVMRKMGLTTKDMIGPESFLFRKDYGKVGNVFFRALFVRSIPTMLNDRFLKDLNEAECQMVTSIIYQPIDVATALKMVKNDIGNVNRNMIDRQKQASKSGYSVDLINPELKDAAAQAHALREDLTSKNQKLFYQTLVIVHFADTKDQLDADTKSIQAVGRRHLIDIKCLNYQQPNGLDTCLPLCNNKLAIRRTLITESASVFMIFCNQELHDHNGGQYYGVNAVSHNLIMLNRRNSKNGNGMILGSPGSGKSMMAKQEILYVILSSNDRVIVIDPDGEYARMAEMLGGEVIHIAPGSSMYLNPFDIDLNHQTEDPITTKSDFICSLCEAIVSDRFGLTAGQKSIIDRCVKMVYNPYLNSRDEITGEYDPGQLPTLKTFYEELRRQDGYEAMQLADALEIYAVGSQNMFAHHTNVKYHKQFVVFDIKDIGNTMKVLGELVVLSTIWNEITKGREEGRNVWFYIDEIYLLFKNQLSAEFLRDLYKRARKYGGIPTGITQNVTDLLENDTARTMIANCEFVLMLSQSAQDRASLGDLLNISPTQMDYITNASPGHGLIYDGQHIVPFINEVPKDSLQYKAMTTKLSEVKALEVNKNTE